MAEIIEQFGISVYSDPPRCKALLGDYCPNNRKEINVLVGALNEKVVEELLPYRGKEAGQIDIRRLIKRLEDNLALNDAAAHWAVESWAGVLGIKSRYFEVSRKGQVENGPTPNNSQTAASQKKEAFLVIASDGTGDYRNLEEALLAAPEGATIFLGEGRHRLSWGFMLNRAVSLVGEGMTKTELVAGQGSYILGYAGEGLFGLRDLTMRWQDKSLNDVDLVVVEKGEVGFENCCFRGVNKPDTFDQAGLRFRNEVRGRVTGCQVEENRLGIIIGGKSQIILQGNICNNNRRGGIVYSESAGGQANKNTFSYNGGNGIQVLGQARPSLEGNTCQNNRGQGIEISGQAKPLLESNTCSNNIGGGIVYSKSAGGQANKNTCSKNGVHGIQVGGQAQPGLEANTCKNNKQVGILFSDIGGGITNENTCNGNGVHGIEVGGQAQPRLEGNTCQNNKFYGILYRGNAGGKAIRNICSENENYGIMVSGQAKPKLDGNICENNKELGIAYLDRKG